MTSIGDAVYAEAQERLRVDINLRAEPQGWGIFDCSGSENARYHLCRTDDVAIFPDDDEVWSHVWNRANENPIGLEAEALGWLKRYSPEEYRCIEAGLPDHRRAVPS